MTNAITVSDAAPKKVSNLLVNTTANAAAIASVALLLAIIERLVLQPVISAKAGLYAC